MEAAPIPLTPSKRQLQKEAEVHQLGPFHAWLIQLQEKKVAFLPLLRRLMGDEEIVGYAYKDFIGTAKPTKGEKLKIFEKLFSEFQREQARGDHGEDKENLVTNLLGSLHLQPPPSPLPAGAAVREGPAPRSVPRFLPCKEVLRACTWNVHGMPFAQHPEDLEQVAQALGQFDLIFLQELPDSELGAQRVKALLRAMPRGYTAIVGGSTELELKGPASSSSSSFPQTQRNALLCSPAWKASHVTSLTQFQHPPICALLTRQADGLQVCSASVHISPTAANGTSTASEAVVQARLWEELSTLKDLYERVASPSTPPPLFMVGSDLNMVPTHLPSPLIFTTPPTMPTAVASGRTLDGFVLSKELLETHQPLIQLLPVNPEAQLSDHHLVTMILMEYPSKPS